MTYTARVELSFEIDTKENRFPRDVLSDILEDIPYLKDCRVIFDAFDGKRVMCDKCIHYVSNSDPDSDEYECEYGMPFVYECRFNGLKYKKRADTGGVI